MRRFLLLMFIGFCTVLAYGQELKPCGTAMLAKRNPKTHAAKARQKSPSEQRVFSGEKKGLIILVEFPDLPFSSDSYSESPLQTWMDIANKQGYADNGAYGSVGDYFYDQSYGAFKLSFDVVGPVMAAQNHGYYGDNIDWGDSFWFDQRVGELVEEACKGVSDQVRFADYDWDDDGEVEQVYILYSGHGENDYWSQDSTVIWPHMASLALDWEGYEGGLVVQDRRVDIYACSNEIDWNNKLAGMGTICHEFSHCLGLPDLYDTYTNLSVLGKYDIMAEGSYNGNGWCPAGYSSYERYACGWLEPQPTDDPASITELLPLHAYPDARIFRTSEDANDYYLIEYREKASWDSYLWNGNTPKAKMLAWHIDYDEMAWAFNEVNTDPDHLRVEWMTVDKIPTAITGVVNNDREIMGIYNLNGLPSDDSKSGILIVRYSDGTTKKVIR